MGRKCPALGHHINAGSFLRAERAEKKLDPIIGYQLCVCVCLCMCVLLLLSDHYSGLSFSFGWTVTSLSLESYSSLKTDSVLCPLSSFCHPSTFPSWYSQRAKAEKDSGTQLFSAQALSFCNSHLCGFSREPSLALWRKRGRNPEEKNTEFLRELYFLKILIGAQRLAYKVLNENLINGKIKGKPANVSGKCWTSLEKWGLGWRRPLSLALGKGRDPPWS